MKKTNIQQDLFDMRDASYAAFQAKLIPNIEVKKIIGVRTPDIKRYVKEIRGEKDAVRFLEKLPHAYFDEDQLHAFLISEEKDFAACIRSVERFLPCIDNWATCDQLSPKVFAKHRKELLPHIERWITSGHTYTVRFAIGMLMQHFLDDLFLLKYPKQVAKIRSEEYYINMMVAWYFATALAKQYDAILPFLEQRKLPGWTHNKAIQKGVESRRLTDKQKAYLKSLRLRKAK